DNVTVNIGFVFEFMPGKLGLTRTSLVPTDYEEIKRALQDNNAKTQDDLTALASLPAADPIVGPHNYYVTKAQGKALGLVGADNTLDGVVTFDSNSNFDYDRTDGITAGFLDFQGVVAHEVSELMGRILTTVGRVRFPPENAYFMDDLFKFTGVGARTFTGTTAGYFSPDNGATRLHAFNTDP